MNARAVKKRLMRGRSNVFWGKRAYLSVRLPISVLPCPVVQPPTIEGYRPDDWEGSWLSLDGQKALHIQRSSGGFYPDTSDAELFHPYETVCGVQQTSDDTWEFWSATVTRKTEDADASWEPLDERVPVDTILAYKAYSEWREKLHGDEFGPIVAAFNEAGFSAKSTHWAVEADSLVVRYGVKWFYADRKFRFCADLSKAVTAARLAGKKVKLLRG